MFGWLKKTVKKADDTLDQTKKVLDESSYSVKTAVKVLTIALGVSIITNVITIITTLSKHKARKLPMITIQNLYLGDKK